MSQGELHLSFNPSLCGSETLLCSVPKQQCHLFCVPPWVADNLILQGFATDALRLLFCGSETNIAVDSKAQ